jgi:hypothetical protein
MPMLWIRKKIHRPFHIKAQQDIITQLQETVYEAMKRTHLQMAAKNGDK